MTHGYIERGVKSDFCWKRPILLCTCATCCELLGDPEVTANIYCKSRNLHNTDTQNYSTDCRLLGHPVPSYISTMTKTK